MKLKCAVIDDEPLARECLESYIQKVDFLEYVASGANPIELSQILRNEAIDIVFLDIQMPYLNGLDFLKIQPVSQAIILTTAFPEYALDSFQYNVFDYLMKPIAFERFFKAVTKVIENKKFTPEESQTDSDYFFVKCDYKYEKIFIHDILFVEAEQNYVNIHTTNRKYMTLLSLKVVEEKLNPTEFVRTHKSFLVAINKIETLENHRLIIQGKEIPISRQHKDEVISRVVSTNLWKRE